jgi:chromosome segregation and condensation protein ScpB
MELSIKIDVTPFAGDDPEVAGQLEKVLGVVAQGSIQRQLDNLINDYSDGRYNFNSEVIEHHFVQLVLSAI